MGFFFFFFQPEDGIRDRLVTGVQTCALPIYGGGTLTKILVIGIAGRMGKTIAGCIEDTEGVELGGGTEQAGSPNLGKDVGEIIGIDKKGIAVSDDLGIAQIGRASCRERV